MTDLSKTARGREGLSRRDLVRLMGAGVAGAVAGLHPVVAHASSPASRGPRAAPGRVEPFPLRDVALLNGPFLDARQRNAQYMLELDPDRLLHGFRRNAGLTPKAPVYGGWESQEPWVDIRCHGHTLGHWLSAGAMHFSATGDDRFRERVEYMALDLSACQDAAGTGLVCAFPDGAAPLLNAIRGEPFPGVPWYTLHKVFAGLRDAHVHAGSDTALAVLARLADWTWEATRGMTEAGFEEMLRREHGGMCEVLADTHALTGDGRYLQLARRFAHRELLDALAEGRDPLDGLHANTQIPKVVGFQRLFELTGEARYGDAARFFWQAVARRRSFATGGHGENEHFFPVSEFAARLRSARTMETCGAHNMLRLTRQLFCAEPDAGYADFHERVLFNAILAAQDPDTGWNTYFQPTRPGYLKFYHTPLDSFWCCTGTGIENHAKYGDSIYFRGAAALYVNLFIASELRWREMSGVVRQTTSFPDEPRTRLTFSLRQPRSFTLHVRCPSWTEGVTVHINGRPVPVAARPGSYLTLEREWRDGDVIDVELPMRLGTESLPGAPDRIAFRYGPLVLAGKLGRAGFYPGADIVRNERTIGMILDEPVEVPTLRGDASSVLASVRAVPGEALTFETAGTGVPRDVRLVPYHRLHHERYTLYWQLTGA